MPVYVTVDVDASQAEDFFDYAGYKSRNMREPLRDVYHEVIMRGINEQFRENGIRSGGWLPLDDLYHERKLAAGFPDWTLIRTEAMEEHLQSERIVHIGIDSLLYEPTMDRVEWHQYGAWNGRGELPARPMIVWLPEDDEKTQRIFEDWLDELRTYNARRPDNFYDRPDALPDIGGFF